MAEEIQKTEGCLLMDREESGEYAEVQTVIDILHESLVEVTLCSEMLSETMMSRVNMNIAYKRVISKKASGSVDSIGFDAHLPYLKIHGAEQMTPILNGQT